MAKKIVLFVLFAVVLAALALAPVVEAKASATPGTMIVVDFSSGAKLFCKSQPGVAVGAWAGGLFYPSSQAMPAGSTNCNRMVDPAKEGVTKVTVGGVGVPILGAFNPTAPFGK